MRFLSHLTVGVPQYQRIGLPLQNRGSSQGHRGALSLETGAAAPAFRTPMSFTVPHRPVSGLNKPHGIRATCPRRSTGHTGQAARQVQHLSVASSRPITCLGNHARK